MRYSRLLVEEEDVGSALEKRVSGGETCETTTDDDDLSHCECIYKVCEVVERGRVTAS